MGKMFGDYIVSAERWMELSPVLTALLAGGICVGANLIFISAFARVRGKG